ncbi:hypothetical protein Pcinc_039232 [Petrolisthes cinctipes]|uniref:DOMON domain-containing protein n=1 Tax=Petrolisthes cinctipes TaxID=88211 RepID=A0AAE1EJQ3_PETCI|nr:hypothetical protein Pcinc_039232 [Petrolisthes cinctipes]KAK3854278.1 hypothetical protein Pcinc_039232 [Petrolisthes cinctipes]
MLGVAPQTKLNCEVLWDDLALEVRWAVAGESVVMQLVGRISDGEYMAFGLSGSPTRSVMTGGDVTVGWLERATGRGVAQDYFLGAKSQCQGGRGSCPDEQVTGGKNNVRLLNAALINDFTMLTYQRPLHSSLDHHNTDQPILTNSTQAVIWAVGPVNSQGHTSYHTLRLRGDMFVNFGRTPEWNCPIPEDHPPAPSSPNSRPPQSSSGPSEPAAAPPAPNPWYIPPIPCDEPEDGVLYAQIGPTGGVNGYNAITGHVGWGISWYINGLLIPEINVVRGKTYTFVVEGGYDPERPARYHPFYITDDPEGGYEFKTPAQRDRTRVFAGVGQDRDGSAVPNAFGRLCEWSPNPNQPTADAFDSFGGYQRTLTLDCQEGQPGILQWTPDAETPDLVYYQCYTHRFLGWKINVHDGCNEGVITASGSNQQATVVLPDTGPSPTSPHFFTSDGRPLPPDSLPAPPRLLVGGQRHHSSATLTNRPQTRPYQGEYPPPIPQNIPPLAQFTPQQQQQQQQQPFRRPSITLPPLPPSPSATATATASGSAPRPILLPAPPQFIIPTATTTATTTTTTTITNTKGFSRRHRVTPSPSSSGGVKRTPSTHLHSAPSAGVKRTPPPHPHSAPSAGVKRTPPPRPHPSAPSTGVKRTPSSSSGVKRTPSTHPHPSAPSGVKRTQSSSSGVKRTPSPSSGVDKTHLTILKDVWAALTHS